MNHPALTLTAALGLIAFAPGAYAQTPPRPAVQVRQLPDLWHNVWPGDFNRDGRTDLVAGQHDWSLPRQIGRVVVRLGNGSGTFGNQIVSGTVGRPLTTGHFNADASLDVVVVTHDGIVSILPGNGNGTFAAARRVDDVDDVTFALHGDLNADGLRDLVVGHAGGVDVHPGLGNFAFGPKVTLSPGWGNMVSAGIMADLNGDGRRDLAVAQGDAYVTIYLNRGGLLFDRSEIFVAWNMLWGLTAGDLDRDGDQDLVLTQSYPVDDWGPGGVWMIAGNGNGTFATPVRYTTGVNGPYSVVLGHFNGDAVLDVAVGSRSWIYVDQNGPTAHYWDSVAIFPGLGDGTLGNAAVFRLDTDPADVSSPCFGCYVDTHHSLKTSDVNGDGRTDLITSPGAIVLNRPAAANRAPVADAGPDRAVDPDHLAHMSVRITELDWDWLAVEWQVVGTGRVVSRVPSFWHQTFQDETLRVTVTDVRGGVATDTVAVRIPPTVEILRPQGTIAAGTPYSIRWTASDNVGLREFDIFFSTDQGSTFAPLAECTNLAGGVRSCVWRNPSPIGPGVLKIVATDTTGVQGDAWTFFDISSNPTGNNGLPPDWTCTSVGAVAARETCSQSAGVFTIEGSGAGIGGTTDEFAFAGDVMVGNFSITARVTSVENVDQWTKVGLMIREESYFPGSRHAALLVTPTTVRGTTFQRRTTRDGATTSTQGPATTAPVWLKLTRSGNTIRAFYRKNITNSWTLVGSQTFTSLSSEAYAMLVVSSQVDGTLATGVFDNVIIDDTEAMTSVDIGGSAAGTTLNDGATVTMEGDGAGIWGTADAFRFRYTQWSGDGTITARLRSLENTSTGAKAGVMFRESLAAGSKHVMGAVYAAGGVVLQTRAATGGTSGEVARRSGTAPEWVRLRRAGDTFTVAASNDGVTWSTVGTTTVAMGQTIYVGLPVTSRVVGTLATAVFDDLWIRP